MRDDETGSWWQQISGRAIQGKMKGAQLASVDMDELSFAIWKRENPNGRVLRPDENAAHSESADWESLWNALRDVFLFWIGHGVRIFRVDNPHTKSFRFCIDASI